MFKKTNQQRLFEDLVNQIEEAILDGRLKAGDKLPSQRDLVSMFQTSRGPLREALRVLEQKGLLEIKRGVRGGAVVKHPGTTPVSESLGLLIRHRKITLAELAELGGTGRIQRGCGRKCCSHRRNSGKSGRH
jgi:DNA-binding FadR family transcriptional regulator